MPKNDKLVRFTDIIGHDAKKQDLSQLIGSPGAYLFYGPPSSGKRTISYKIAQYTLCTDTKEDGCTCRFCKNFIGDHPDFLYLGQNNKILVKDLDNLIDFVSRAPLCSETKIVIIDNAEVISAETSNRLLKTLEESPFTFFLITSKINAIIPTIQSRCFKIKFDSLAQEDITNILWNKMGYELNQARFLGWMGSASSIDIFSQAGSYVTYREMAFEFIDLLSQSDFLIVWDYIDRIPRKDLSIFIDMLVLLITDMLLLSTSIEDIINPDRRSDLQKMAKKHKTQALIASSHILSQIKKYGYLNINMDISLKSAMIKVWAINKA